MIPLINTWFKIYFLITVKRDDPQHTERISPKSRPVLLAVCSTGTVSGIGLGASGIDSVSTFRAASWVWSLTTFNVASPFVISAGWQLFVPTEVFDKEECKDGHSCCSKSATCTFGLTPSLATAECFSSRSLYRDSLISSLKSPLSMLGSGGRELDHWEHHCRVGLSWD